MEGYYEKFCENSQRIIAMYGRILLQLPTDSKISEQIQKKIYYDRK